ncbi:MAG: CvpA family protein [Acetobacter sp.]|jgi:membrane protein required for colicin V production|nr:CvpA family protein [Acetobacter sp.]MCH4061430.1 CvpA family protein [Acetobacter sp.]MCI1294062.1 CvpA family protein [Acetobacter sp.]MCI1320719.1 CvpA family protein [Acetobacter sp.]MCI1374019.1 CvpA family protein [Acetobacter sp.]
MAGFLSDFASILTLPDIVAMLITIFSALMGLWRGFSRELFGLTAWLLAITGALRGFSILTPWLDQKIPNPQIAAIIAFLLIFLLILILCFLITARITSIVKASPLAGPDRLLGLCFGLLRGALISLLLFVAGDTFMPTEEWKALTRGSLISPFADRTSSYLRPILPAFLTRGLAQEGPAGHEQRQPDGFPGSGTF